MIVYRCISERELACMLGIKNDVSGPRGNNTFKYEKDIEYRHFFYHYDSAISFMDSQNLDRYYNKYSTIIAYDIKDELLKKYFGLGQYNLSCIPTSHKDDILQYFKTIYFPEFAIPSTLITNDMIVGIGNKKRITPVSYIYYDDMNDIIRKSEQNFLEYEKWLFENGTNVPIDLVLENSEKLFPINNDKINKKL